MITEQSISGIESRFNELKKGNKSIIPDGIIKLDRYNKAKFKMLWVLKEPHCENGGGWDMSDFLSNPSDLLIRKDKFSWLKTYKLIMLTSWGILNDLQSWEKSLDVWNKQGSAKLLEVLSDIAYINLKKTPGGSSSSPASIANSFKANKDLIIDQIKAYQPDCTICGGTYKLLFPFFEQYAVLSKNRFVNAYHPNQRKMPHQQYYYSIINQVKLLTNI